MVQNTTGKKTIKLKSSINNKSTVETIVKTYEHHPSIKLIKEHIQKNKKLKSLFMEFSRTASLVTG